MDDLPPCIISFFQDLIQTPRALLDKYTLPADGGAAIAHAISARTAAAFSDGSCGDYRQAGSSTFIIAPNKDKGAVWLEGANFVTGLPDKLSSYQRELAGVFGVLTCVEALVKFYKISAGSITIAPDRESAIYQSDSEWPLSIDQSFFDYIQFIRNMIKDIPISVKFHWVEGQQKEKGLTLDWWAR